MNDTIVVFGAGQIGGQVTEQLLAAGHRVRQVRRSGVAKKEGRLEVRVGDLTDLAFAKDVSVGASGLVHCAVPPYHQWSTLLEPMTAGVLHAAKTSGAPLVVLDNLYGYGVPDGPMTETSPVNPCSRKGELRARVAASLLDAHRRGDARVALARASDFYGPGITLAAIFGERFLARLQKGLPGECFGPPTLEHSYSYGGDVAAGLVTLALQPGASMGEVWHLPVAPAESTAAVVSHFGRAMGMPKLGTSQVPGFVLQVMGVFSPPVKELLEMRYQWQTPFVLDDTKFRARFGGQATSLEAGTRATVAWLRRAAAA